MVDTKSNRRLAVSDKLHWYHWVVVLASLVLTVSAWYITSEQAKEKTEIQFDYQAKQIVELVKERMHKYEEALWAGVAALHVQSLKVDVNNWHTFSSALSIEQKYPGINGIGVINHISRNELDDFLAKERRNRPNFDVHPKHQRDMLWPITHVEPISTNAKAVGLDMAHEINRRTAAEKAKNTGTTQITGPITLVQDAQRTPGFLFYTPFYKTIKIADNITDRKKDFVGLVYAPFIMNKLMEGTLKNKNRLVNFNISDGDHILYNELDISSEDYDASPILSKTISVDMYGRSWKFELQSSNLFRQQNTSNQPLMILMGGIIIDALLLGMFLLLAGLNKKAIELADKISFDFINSQTKLNTAIHASSSGFAIINREGYFIEANQSLCDWLGYEHGALMKKMAVELIPPSDRILTQSVFNKMFTGEQSELHTKKQCRHKNGNPVWGLLSAAPIADADGKIREIVLHVVDIQKEHELLANLMHQNVALEKSNADLEQFAYIASHDLKSPLNAIQQLASWIQEDAQDVLPAASQEHLKLLTGRTKRMTKLLEDLLNYSRVGRYDYTSETINLATLVEDQLALINKPENFSCIAPNIEIFIPRIPLEIIIRNLISNAVKHHDKEQGTIEIFFERDSENQIITVKDDGPGIPTNMHDKVFEMFQTLESRDVVEGSGMGLAIVKRIASHYNGTLCVNSNTDKGAEFILAWPLNEPLKFQMAS